MNEILIKLLCAMDRVYDEYMCDCGCFDYLIDDFLEELNDIFRYVKLEANILSYINSLNTDLFTSDYYLNNNLKENVIFKQIQSYVNESNEKKKINFDFDLVLSYIDSDYHLINYLNNITEDQIIKLGIINPKILYLVDNISCDILIQILKENCYAACVLDGNIICDENLYKSSYLYINKEKLLANSKLYELYISCLQKYLEDNILEYIRLSDKARSDVKLAKFVLGINPKLLVYTNDNIKDNKEIMMHLINLDIDNAYYLSERLKKDNDISKILNDYN